MNANKSNVAASSNVSKPSQHRESSAHDQVNRNWIPVLHNGNKKSNKLVAPATKLNRQLITLSNRFTPLSGIQESKVPRETITFTEVEHNKGRGLYNKKQSNIIWSKILILGDSHAEGCSHTHSRWRTLRSKVLTTLVYLRIVKLKVRYLHVKCVRNTTLSFKKPVMNSNR